MMVLDELCFVPGRICTASTMCRYFSKLNNSHRCWKKKLTVIITMQQGDVPLTEHLCYILNFFLDFCQHLGCILLAFSSIFLLDIACTVALLCIIFIHSLFWQALQEEFVAARKDNPSTMSVNDFHRLLSLVRYEQPSGCLIKFCG